MDLVPKRSPLAAPLRSSSVSTLFTAMLVALFFVGCGEHASKEQDYTLSVAAASNLRPVLPELIAAFETKHPDIKVRYLYGSTGSLFSQVENGAPFDVLLAADVAYAHQLVKDGFAKESDVFPYTVGKLVLWVSNDAGIQVDKGGIKALADKRDRFRTIAIANPMLAPYGQAAEKYLKDEGVYSLLRDRLVFAENIEQTAQYADSGVTDAAFIAQSRAQSEPLASKGTFLVIDQKDHRLEQAGVVLRKENDRQDAERLRDFLLSDQAQKILNDAGYQSPASLEK